MALVKSTATVGAYTLVSRFLGFFRDTLIAAFIGAGPVADAFFVAFKLPNLFRRLFAEGAFNAGFVPLYAAMLEREGRAAAELFASQVLSVLLTALIAFTLAIEAIMPGFVAAIAPGFNDEPYKFGLAVEFTRITFPYLLFMSLCALQGGILNSLYRFSAAAAAPILLNVVTAAFLIGLGHRTQTPGHALSWGVAVSGAAQFLLLHVACRAAGVRLRLPRPRLTPDVRKLLRLVGPASIGAGVMQVNLLIGTMLASLLPTGAISYLYYADRVNEMPVAVVGVAIGTALLPMISRQLRSDDPVQAGHSLNRGLELALLLALPAMAALMVAATPIVAVLFERGEFGPAATQSTAAALIAFAFGLPAFVLVKVLSVGFYARHDTSTPVKIALAAVLTDIVLSLALMWEIGHIGIAVATAAASWVNTIAMTVILRRRGHLDFDARLRARAPRILAAAAIMAGAVWAALAWGAPLLAAGDWVRVPALGALVLWGMGVFAAAVLALGGARIAELRGYFRRRPA